MARYIIIYGPNHVHVYFDIKVKFKLNINLKNKLLAWFCLRFDFDLSMSRWGEKIS